MIMLCPRFIWLLFYYLNMINYLTKKKTILWSLAANHFRPFPQILFLRGPRDGNEVSDEKWMKSPVNLLATHPESNQGNWVSDMKLPQPFLPTLNNDDKTLHWFANRNRVSIPV